MLHESPRDLIMFIESIFVLAMTVILVCCRYELAGNIEDQLSQMEGWIKEIITKINCNPQRENAEESPVRDYRHALLFFVLYPSLSHLLFTLFFLPSLPHFSPSLFPLSLMFTFCLHPLSLSSSFSLPSLPLASPFPLLLYPSLFPLSP